MFLITCCKYTINNIFLIEKKADAKYVTYIIYINVNIHEGRHIIILCKQIYVVKTYFPCRGKSFRHDYIQVPKVRVLLSNVPVMALTATATQEMVDEILMHLRISKDDTDFVAVLPDRY